ncbi:MAG TPA: hypothetical protein VNT79_02210 [Phycisphaerae bacterium]|nr:hypothetical protein [Phycisphaerae bacterium]
MAMRFERLPHVETVVRLTISVPFDITLNNIIRLKDRFLQEKQFTGLADLDGLEVPPGAGTWSLAGISPVAIQGAKFVGNAIGLELTMQMQLLALRWTARSGAAYPGFVALCESLRTLVGVILEEIGTAEQKTHAQIVAVVNLGYISLATPGGKIEKLTDVLSECAQAPLLRGGRVDKIHNFTLSWRETDGVDLRLDLSTQEKAGSTSKETRFRILTVAGKTLENSTANPFDTLVSLHSRLEDTFLAVISENAKTDWGLQTQ